MKNKVKKIGIALVGCGEIGIENALAIKRSQNSSLKAVMDIDSNLANDIGKRLNVPAFTDLDRMLDINNIDAVFISTPPDSRKNIIMKAAKKRKHIIVEKPMAPTVIDIKDMIRMCRENNVLLSPCFCYRYLPEITKAKELIEKGALGELLGVLIITHLDRPAYYYTSGRTGRSKSEWRMSKERSGGGVLMTNAIHLVDLARYLTGMEMRDFFSIYDSLNNDFNQEDCCTVGFRFENGAIGNISASSCVIASSREFEIRFWGKSGRINISDFCQYYSLKRINGKKPKRWHSFGKLKELNIRTEFIRNLGEAILSNKQPDITGEDGLATQIAMETMYKAGRI